MPIAARLRWRLASLCVAVSVLWASPASADWRRTTAINANSAYTLEQGMVEIGVLTPLTIGVTDEFQAALHPLLLLLGQPYLALRWRMTNAKRFAVASNLGGSWSFIRRETAEGEPEGTAPDGEQVGFPGTVQLTITASVRLGKHWLVSAGGGPAVDFLGGDPIRGMAELHLSGQWLPTPKHLVSLQLSGYLDASDGGRLRRPLALLTYAYALSTTVNLGGGLGFGEFIFEKNLADRVTLNVFPVLDVWFRF